jgi:hypothetical protein
MQRFASFARQRPDVLFVSPDPFSPGRAATSLGNPGEPSERH